MGICFREFMVSRNFTAMKDNFADIFKTEKDAKTRSTHMELAGPFLFPFRTLLTLVSITLENDFEKKNFFYGFRSFQMNTNTT